MRRLALTVIAATLSILPVATAQQNYVPIEQRFTDAQRQATGLDRLTPAELALLNSLLRDEQAATASANIGLRAPRAAAEPERTRVENRIKGDFRGWSPGARLELENGQVWHVIEGELHARRVMSPSVTISPGLVSGWYLQVEGQSPRAKVRREK